MMEQRQLNEKLVRFSKEFLGNFCLADNKTLDIFERFVDEQGKLVWLLHYEVVNYCLGMPSRKMQDDFMRDFSKLLKARFTYREVYRLRDVGVYPKRWAEEVKARGNWSFTLKKIEDAYRERGAIALDPLIELVGSACFKVDFKHLAWYYYRTSNDLQRSIVLDFLKGCGYLDVYEDFKEGMILEYLK